MTGGIFATLDLLPGAETRDARAPEAGGDTGGRERNRGVQGLIGAERGGPAQSSYDLCKPPLSCLWTLFRGRVDSSAAGES